MTYDAVRMLELSQRLAKKLGGVGAVVAVQRLCSKEGLSTQEIFEVGIERGRDALIAKLYREGFSKGLAMEQIGECFGLTRERIRQILANEGVTRRSGAPIKWKAALESLTKKQVLQVMCKAASDPRFWSPAGLKISLVLKELVFPEMEGHTNTKAWRAVVRRFSLETRKVGVIIKYRERRDPGEFLHDQYYTRSMTLPEIAERLNKGQRVTVVWQAIKQYMNTIGISTFGKGPRG